MKTGKIEVLYFYDQLKDEEYKINFEQEILADKFKADRYIINYGEDFEKYYLGSLHVDFETKLYKDWKGKEDKLSEQDVMVLADTLFNPGTRARQVTMFTPTRPSDFNITRTRNE